jgi:hypothetical protein
MQLKVDAESTLTVNHCKQPMVDPTTLIYGHRDHCTKHRRTVGSDSYDQALSYPGGSVRRFDYQESVLTNEMQHTDP